MTAISYFIFTRKILTEFVLIIQRFLMDRLFSIKITLIKLLLFWSWKYCEKYWHRRWQARIPTSAFSFYAFTSSDKMLFLPIEWNYANNNKVFLKILKGFFYITIICMNELFLIESPESRRICYIDNMVLSDGHLASILYL